MARGTIVDDPDDWQIERRSKRPLMKEDTRTHWIVVQTGAQLTPTVKNTEPEARELADMMVRLMGAREVSVYKLVATFRAEPVVVVVDADPNTDGRGIG